MWMSRATWAPKLTEPVAAIPQLVVAFLAGIAVIVVLITVVKLHPFLGLIFGALTVGLVAGEDFAKALKSFTDGFGSTAASVGILIALVALQANANDERDRALQAQRHSYDVMILARTLSGTIARADLMFTAPQEPWNATGF